MCVQNNLAFQKPFWSCHPGNPIRVLSRMGKELRFTVVVHGTHPFLRAAFGRIDDPHSLMPFSFCNFIIEHYLQKVNSFFDKKYLIVDILT